MSLISHQCHRKGTSTISRGGTPAGISTDGHLYDAGSSALCQTRLTKTSMGRPKHEPCHFAVALSPALRDGAPIKVRWAAGTKQGEEPKRGRHDPLRTGSSFPPTPMPISQKGTPLFRDGSCRTSNVGSVLDTNAKKPRQGAVYAVRVSDGRFAEMPLRVVIIVTATETIY